MARNYDWVAIEADYRTGKHSNRELSRLHGPSEAAIRKKANAEGWSKDLSTQVRAATRAKSVQSTVKKRLEDQGTDTSQGISDKQIIEAASELGAEVLTQHKQRIDRLQRAGDVFVERLEAQLTQQTLAVQTKSGDIAEIDLPLDYVSKCMLNGTGALERLIKLERQAHGLDEDDNSKSGKTLDELLSKVAPDEEPE